MIYLIDTPPNFCPNCGNDLRSGWQNKYNREDFHANASHSCDCGARFQHVGEIALIRCAQEHGGDLAETL